MPTALVYLLTARQYRIQAKADPANAEKLKDAARFWIVLARQTEGPKLP